MTRSLFLTAAALGLAFVFLVAFVTSVTRTAGARFADYTVQTDSLQPRGVAIVLAAPGHATGLKEAMLAADYVVLTIEPTAWQAWQARQHTAHAAAAAELARLGAALGHRYGLDTATKPILTGGPDEARELVSLAAGAPLFHALITVGFCPAESPLHFSARAFSVPWYAFQRADAPCTPAAERQLAGFTNAHLIKVASAPLSAPEFSALLQWLDPSRGAQTAPAGSINGLPLVEVGATGRTTSDLFAVFLSGDGGWADLDQHVASLLAAQGIPVVGWDSLSYYWRERTPGGAANDLAEIIRHYAGQWHKLRVVLVGYSFGANVLPFLINRLPQDERRQVALATFISMTHHASFEFHLSQWVDETETPGPETAPELLRLASVPLLCIAGADDREARCPPLAPPNVSLVLPGDHHFGGDYAGLARAILRQIEGR